MERLNNILVVAYYAPPSNSSGTFRTLGFIRHLDKMGWKTTLLTVTFDNKGKDQMHTRKLPRSTKVVRAVDLDCFRLWEKVRSRMGGGANFQETEGAQDHKTYSAPHGCWNTVKEWVTTFLKIPDQQTGWLGPAVIRCLFLPKPTLIYSSAPPFTGHLIGLFCKYLWRVPLVCDFRDPWTDNPFRRPKPPCLDKWDRWLEGLVLSRSDLVVANTGKVASIFRQKKTRRLPEIVAIPNGYDPEDFVDVEPMRLCPREHLLLVHAGLLYGERNPINFLKAIQTLLKHNACQLLQVVLIGSAVPIEGLTLEEHVEQMGLSTNVQTHPPVPHAEALSILKGADALLLLALGTTLQVPAKLFEYFGLQKPVLSIAEPDSATEEITRRFPELIFSAHNEPGSIQAAVRALYNRWAKGEIEAPSARESKESLMRSMQRQQQVKVLAKHFSDLANKGKN